MWPPIPLADWAQQQLDAIGPDLPRADDLLAAELLTERARLNGFALPGIASAGGGCRWWRTQDGWLALNLARAQDLELLPAFLGEDDPGDLARALASRTEADLVARGRLLGMALAGLNELPASPAVTCTQPGGVRRQGALRVLDLSALWAGPLAARLLRMAGAEVTRVESRADPTETSDPAHFSRLAQGKKVVRIDLKTPFGRAQMVQLVAGADVVIEAARPRALVQLGIDADALVAAQPGLVWITVTGHGVAGEAANWVGLGDDAAVAGGLSRELHAASGKLGFVGDAIADPLTGIAAARLAQCAPTGGRYVLSMSGIVAEAIATTRARDLAAWQRSLKAWAEALPC